jgi:lipopolysaccharide transport system permease protein
MESADYEIRITPARRLSILDWRGLWDFRDLLIQLVRRDYVSKYSQTILGPLWFVVQPILTTLMLSFAFGRIARIPTDGMPPFLFYLCGMLCWNYFSSTFTSTCSTFVSNAALFGKVYFPRLIVPLAAVISNLFTFAIQFLLFVACVAFFVSTGRWSASGWWRWELLLLPLIVAHVGVVSLGIGLWFSALTVRYRDLTHVSGFLLSLWLYATPIIYPLSLVPAKWTWLFHLNPLTFPTEFTRYVLLGRGTFNVTLAGISFLSAALILIVGLLEFQKRERSFVDTV